MLAHIYVAPGFEEVELVTIADILRRGGVDTRLISLDETPAQTGAHGITLHTDQPFSAAEGMLADAIILPGGGPGTQAMLASPALHVRLQAHKSAGKLVAAICAAPMVLAKAGALAGETACCFPGCEATLNSVGASVSAYNVVESGSVITSRGPATAASFALTLLGKLAGETAAREVGRAMLYL
ncbi:DJ-1 family glyoxalase III [Chitinilyticum piscinae]|uniref:DJ-1/PfpI family protein n=1 Tax=Chitinilyticum piscinae TaxID=2866724 RepID=A0A8J7K8H2_9NEIS|nr:DJ-1 family glyoxalase III [Chitinilyticum piscinae]MBE9609508.1 DJ-1/PfpI family protein [Chitinilyticum piscinae]